MAGCGGGGGGSPAPAATAAAPAASQPAPAPAPQPAPQPPVANTPFSDLLIIGNSITRMPPSAEMGWPGEWGMAASAPEKDFAHLTAAALNLPLTALNFSQLEKDPLGNLWQIPSYVQSATLRTAAVVELGDNALTSSVSIFAIGYGSLLDALHAGKLVCVSTWWRDEAKDAVIEQACKSHGGRYVFIGDIYPQRGDDIGRFANADVDRHPHDWSMQVIATRVTAAITN